MVILCKTKYLGVWCYANKCGQLLTNYVDHIHQVEIKVPVPFTDHYQVIPVWVPGAVVVTFWMGSNALRVGAVSLHDVDFVVPIAVGGEGDVFAIRGKDWMAINAGGLGDAGLVTAISFHDVDLVIFVAVGRKDDVLAIGRERRVKVAMGSAVIGQSTEVFCGGLSIVGIVEVENCRPFGKGHKPAIGRNGWPVTPTRCSHIRHGGMEIQRLIDVGNPRT